MRNFILFFLILLVAPKIFSQSDAMGMELEQLFERVRIEEDNNVKLRIADSVNMYLQEYASSKDIFSHHFESLRFLGQITSPDSLLKILCWNLPLEFPEGKYFSFIIRKSPSGNRVHKLFADYGQGEISTDNLYSAENWYGALYYDLRPVIDGGSRYWMVLGLDYGNPSVTRKIIDVIHFGEKGDLTLGRKWFEAGNGLSARVIFEYSIAATMSLRFDADNSIIFGHLVPFAPEMIGNRQYYGPDFTFDSYTFTGGTWKFSENVKSRE